MSSTNFLDNQMNFQSYYPSLASLREAHKELLIRHRNTAFSAELASEIAAFMIKGSSTGLVLDGEKDRGAAQGILDYWLSVLYSEDIEPPEATLADFDPSLAPELDDSLCPYLGLEAFREENRQYFYGRQGLLDKLIKKLKESQLLVVIGPSGSGKSSVVLGGLIPSLKAGKLSGSENWHYHPSIVPGSNPLANLARLLCPEDVEANDRIEKQTEQFLQNPNHLNQLLSHADGQPSVLVIDQFEEMFTLCLDERKRQALIDNVLGGIQSSEIPHRIILTMRIDFESRVTKIPIFYPLFEKAKVHVTPLDAGELREAIEKPAKLVGLKLKEELVDKLIQDVLGEPAALPLLQFTLLKLWDKRERNHITQETYQKLGGCRLALSNSADEFYNNLIPQDQEICKRIFLKMVSPTIEEYEISSQPSPDESQGASKNKIVGWEVTSSRIRQNELYQTPVDQVNVEKVLNKLKEARLIKITKGDSLEDTQVEVAHEALIRNWFLLRDWLNDERVNLRQRLRFKTAAIQWEEQGRDESALLRGALLEEARQYDDLNELETEFIQESINYEDEIRNKEKERLRLLEEQVILLEKQKELDAKNNQLLAEQKKSAEEKVKLFEKQQELSRKNNKLKNRIIIIFVLALFLSGTLAILARRKANVAETNLRKYEQARAAEAQARAAEAQARAAEAQARAEELQNSKEFSKKLIAESNDDKRKLDVNTAREKEEQGFKALLRGNVNQARVYFYDAYYYFPTYHNVDEIFKLLSNEIEAYNQADQEQRSQQLSTIFGQILTRYSWGMPSNLQKQMRVKFLKNYRIGIYYYSQRGSSLRSSAQEIKTQLIQYGLPEQTNCSAQMRGVCLPESKDSIWFQGRLAGNTIRYYKNTEYEVAYVLQQVLAEVYPQKEFRLQPVTTPTPNSISIFLN